MFQAATEKMFAAINQAQPDGIRYASLLLADGETFVPVVRVDDGGENPIPGFPEFRELQELVEGSRAAPQCSTADAPGLLSVVLTVNAEAPLRCRHWRRRTEGALTGRPSLDQKEPVMRVFVAAATAQSGDSWCRACLARVMRSTR
jgi:hypothetical protein